MDEISSDLRQRVEDENLFITNLIDTIPPSFYFDAETRTEITKNKQRDFKRNIKGLNPRHNGKNLTNSTKNMRLKLDPLHHKTISQLQEELSQQAGNKEPGASVKYGKANEDVHARYMKKLQLLKGNRPVSKAEDDLENKRLKRRLNKQKLRNKRRNDKVKVKIESQENEQTLTKSPEKKPKFNADGKMLFSKFDFPETDKPTKKTDGKDYKTLLQKVRKESKDWNEMKQKNPEKAEAVKEKKTWSKAILRAGGTKVKDDAYLLKRASDKKEGRKIQSKKRWEKIVETTENRKTQRQDKRKANILAKKQEKVKKKIKKAVKKGRYFPDA